MVVVEACFWRTGFCCLDQSVTLEKAQRTLTMQGIKKPCLFLTVRTSISTELGKVKRREHFVSKGRLDV